MNTFTFSLPDCPQDHRFYRRKADPFPFSTKPKTPDEVLNLAKQCLFYWLHKLLMVTHITADPLHFNVDMPYCVVPIIKGPIPEEMMWYIWALSAQYDCAIVVPAFTLYHLLCEQQFSGTYLDQLLSMFAPTPLWRGKLYNALQAQGIWHVSYRKKNNINIVGYSKIWPIKERDCLNTLVSHLYNCNNPGLQVITGIEGLSLAEEEASSSQNTIQEGLNQFQTDFFTSSIIFPTPPLSQESDPPTHVDAGIDDYAIEEYDRLGDRYGQQTDDDFPPHMEHDDFADHKPIIK
ncbi:hypothetical protein PIB30_057919 [Stylosanthes scabra]|uniref:Uncharacterized protein n=1 Tax=Stylosanthes scabra TaxID=79078 RepID=A0ABU6RK41_9FABA|nr:hypothetical protein [Stylosanthes scabra]